MEAANSLCSFRFPRKSMKPRILIIDDEVEILENLDRLLSDEGYDCFTLAEPRRFRELMPEARPDVLITDLRMPVVDGMTLLAIAKADDPLLPVIVITGHATVGSAVEAIQEGAFDYLAKPFSADQLAVVVDRAIRYRRLMVENEELKGLAGRTGPNIIGSSSQTARLLDQIQRVAPTDANVLIVGESGTGKELVAQGVHHASRRNKGPFIPVDCASLPEGLLESELFGHEKGAFTGAVAQRKGLVEDANGGTLFLDEIGEMPLALQAKLLRVLEQRQVRRVGRSQTVDVDVRFVAATNVDLEAAVKDGAFREDLYYRLNVVKLSVPPLRARPGDIVLLAEHFLRNFATTSHRSPPMVSPDAWDALERFRWPGNVRQLRNVIERAVALDSDGKVTVADLPSELRMDSTNGVGPEPQRDGAPRLKTNFAAVPYAEARDEAMNTFRSAYLQQLLDMHEGNISQAARSAGISRRTLHRWLSGGGTDSGEG